MKVIQFDVEKAKSGKYKIQTRDGKPVRIICWNKKGENEQYDDIVALVKENNHENCILYSHCGLKRGMRAHLYDLVLVDESAPILPKWKFIKKGKKLPEMAYVKTKAAGVCHIPSSKGVKVGCDCWYLPATVLDELENEI